MITFAEWVKDELACYVHYRDELLVLFNIIGWPG
jgi:hypothetical protein